jgi:hypothetical protein
MNNLIATIAALGVPGLVLLVAMYVSGFAGAAAITAALAALGGPLGMLGGIAVLGVMVLISRGLTQYGFERIYQGVVQQLIENGETTESIREKIQGYPISQDLKNKLLELLGPDDDEQSGASVVVRR